MPPIDYRPKPKRSPAKVAHAVRRAQRKSTAAPPRTDAQTSGRNYGVKRAERFKKTRPYRKAVETAVRAQPAAKRAERVNQVADRIRKGRYTGHTIPGLTLFGHTGAAVTTLAGGRGRH